MNIYKKMNIFSIKYKLSLNIYIKINIKLNIKQIIKKLKTYLPVIDILKLKHNIIILF